MLNCATRLIVLYENLAISKSASRFILNLLYYKYLVIE